MVISLQIPPEAFKYFKVGGAGSLLVITIFSNLPILPVNKDFFNEKEKINKVIEKINLKLTLLEKIKRIQLIDENFSIENGLMTPTMKVKRKKVTEKYKNQLENLY